MSKTNINKCILTTYSPDKDGYFEVEFEDAEGNQKINVHGQEKTLLDGLSDSECLEEWFFGGSAPRDLAEAGIYPNKIYEIEFDMWSDQYWTDYGYEYDCGVNWEIIKESESCISTQ